MAGIPDNDQSIICCCIRMQIQPDCEKAHRHEVGGVVVQTQEYFSGSKRLIHPRTLECKRKHVVGAITAHKTAARDPLRRKCICFQRIDRIKFGEGRIDADFQVHSLHSLSQVVRKHVQRKTCGAKSEAEHGVERCKRRRRTPNGLKTHTACGLSDQQRLPGFG